jgi:hypothetical protein
VAPGAPRSSWCIPAATDPLVGLDRSRSLSDAKRRLAGEYNAAQERGELPGMVATARSTFRTVPCHGDLLLRLANASREERIA